MILYALTVLLSAFLLFQVQPVIAKIILPWFGGSAAVWTTCLLFFQMVLLLGYLYAHAVIRYLQPRAQLLLHAALLAASVATLPINPDPAWKPAGGADPTLGILRVLSLTVGLPYFLLSTTGPLLQAWYARRYKGGMPYRLYALSNAGSMFALISYPVLFEPVFTAGEQTRLWSVVYGVFILLCGFTAFAARKGPGFHDAAVETDAPRPGPQHYGLWLALPACASMLLLAITNHLSQNVAAIPFLWVLPLSIYLLTFILCFEGRGWYKRNPYFQVLAVAIGSMAYAVSVESTGTVKIQVMLPLFVLGLFTCCMVLHGELARLKPHPRYLTHFYLMLAAGGALGGLLVGIVAPQVFNALYEMQLGLGACAFLALASLRFDRDEPLSRQLPPALPLLFAFAVAAMVGYAGYFRRGAIEDLASRAIQAVAKKWTVPQDFGQTVAFASLVLAALLIALIFRSFRVRQQWIGLTAEVVGLVLAGYLGHQVAQMTVGYRLTARNFYGALRVRDSGTPSDFAATRTLTHGTINHGEQLLYPVRRNLPTTYYGPNTGVGLAIRDRQQKTTTRVGVIGLGTGTLASYGRPGDYYRFYEINPLVLRLAKSEFYYLPECKAKWEVAMGDARLSLEREQPQNFDLLAVDAFSSDSIPVHLLTREAMDVYFRHLRPDGILAVHISNRYLDLQPVLAGEIASAGKLARLVDTEDDESQDVFGATWVLVTSANSGFGGELASTPELKPSRTVRLWTDEYSNLFRILK